MYLWNLYWCIKTILSCFFLQWYSTPEFGVLFCCVMQAIPGNQCVLAYQQFRLFTMSCQQFQEITVFWHASISRKSPCLCMPGNHCVLACQQFQEIPTLGVVLRHGRYTRVPWHTNIWRIYFWIFQQSIYCFSLHQQLEEFFLLRLLRKVVASNWVADNRCVWSLKKTWYQFSTIWLSTI